MRGCDRAGAGVRRRVRTVRILRHHSRTPCRPRPAGDDPCGRVEAPRHGDVRDVWSIAALPPRVDAPHTSGVGSMRASRSRSRDECTPIRQPRRLRVRNDLRSELRRLQAGNFGVGRVHFVERSTMVHPVAGEGSGDFVAPDVEGAGRFPQALGRGRGMCAGQVETGRQRHDSRRADRRPRRTVPEEGNGGARQPGVCHR